MEYEDILTECICDKVVIDAADMDTDETSLVIDRGNATVQRWRYFDPDLDTDADLKTLCNLWNSPLLKRRKMPTLETMDKAIDDSSQLVPMR